MVVQACNASTWEVEARGLHNEILFPKTKGLGIQLIWYSTCLACTRP
jgi:hypothetical protein